MESGQSRKKKIAKRIDKIMTSRKIEGKTVANMINDLRSNRSTDGDYKTVSQTTISKWRNATTGIDLSSLIELAEVFHVTLDYLAGLNDTEPGNEAKELAVVWNILNLDPIARSLKISKALDVYLSELHKAAQALDNGMDSRVYDTWIEVAQKNYLENVKSELFKDEFVEYEVFPKGYLDEKIRMLKLEYGRIPAPAAGDGGP